jgi:hypothetical protein
LIFAPGPVLRRPNAYRLYAFHPAGTREAALPFTQWMLRLLAASSMAVRGRVGDPALSTVRHQV